MRSRLNTSRFIHGDSDARHNCLSIYRPIARRYLLSADQKRTDGSVYKSSTSDTSITLSTCILTRKSRKQVADPNELVENLVENPGLRPGFRPARLVDFEL